MIGAWLLYYLVPEYGDWWMMFFIAVSVVVFYPAQLAWRRHVSDIRRASRNGLCATCKYFAPRMALCSKLDEEVREDYTPCGGEGWDPAAVDLSP